MSRAASAVPIRVFVHLAHGFGVRNWQTQWNRGEIIGINEHLPYGYFWAEQDGCIVEYSEDKTETRFSGVFRLSLRLLLGFDFIHAWRNRRGITKAKVVWTHTESQYLAVLLLLQTRARSCRPKIIAQSVWLFDRWGKLSLLRRWLYSKLIVQADVLTVHSPENLKLARVLFPACRSEMIPFGIKAEPMLPRGPRAVHHPIRVLSLGNDRHRDWATLVVAAKGWKACMLRLVSRRVKPALARNAANVEIVHPKSNDELMALYEWADIVALAVKPNLHASGITVVQEATLCGVPVICTDTGGLRAYFSEREVRYVPAEQPQAIRAQISALAKDDDERWAMVERARARMLSAGLTSRRFAQRHAELSRELLSTAETASCAERATTGSNSCSSRPFQRWLPSARASTREIFVVIGFIVATLGSASRPEAAAESTAILDLCAFRSTFIEDFDTLSVSPYGENGSRWIAHTPWGGDFGDAVFTDPRPGFPFRVQDGVLEIEARKGPDGKWRSGLLASVTPKTTGFSQRFGYFEMRAQFPPGPGTWPAFWLGSNLPQGSKQSSVEIDVVEYYGQFTDDYHSVVHVWDNVNPAKSRAEGHTTKVPPGSLTSDFHTYGVDVEKDWITFYLDRQETWRTPTPPEQKAPLMVLVNLALGSGWPIDQTPNPSVMKVDYIHVYARRAPTENASCSSNGEPTGPPPSGRVSPK